MTTGLRLLVACPLWPHAGHTTRAANVVTHQLVAALARLDGVEVGFLKVDRAEDPAPDDAERNGARELADVGVKVFDPVRLPPLVRHGSALAKLLAPNDLHFYPELAHAHLVNAAVDAYRPDVVLIPWSEWVTALCSTVPARRFAYYGNPDHKAGLLRARLTKRHGGSVVEWIKTELYCARLKTVHLGIMRRFDWLGDVAANDAAFYRENGHPNAFYIQNLWIDRFGRGWRERREALEQSHPAPIIGNVGKLFGTANRYGLELLGREVLPELRAKTRPGEWIMRLLGGGDLPPALAPLLAGDDVQVAGFVPDIDEAILQSQVFLCTNNGSDYKVGHTRYLHAWTLGSCVVAHRDASLSMPEIRHGENALLGDDSSGVAERIREALSDKGLRLRLGENGYETYVREFSADRVARDIVARIEGTLTGDGLARLR